MENISEPFEAEISSIKIESQIELSVSKNNPPNTFGTEFQNAPEDKRQTLKLKLANKARIKLPLQDQFNSPVLTKNPLERKSGNEDLIGLALLLPRESENEQVAQESFFEIDKSVEITSYRISLCTKCKEGKVELVDLQLKCQLCKSFLCRVCFMKGPNSNSKSDCQESKEQKKIKKEITNADVLKNNLATLIFTVLLVFMFLNNKILKSISCPVVFEHFALAIQIPIVLTICFALLPFWSTFSCFR